MIACCNAEYQSINQSIYHLFAQYIIGSNAITYVVQESICNHVWFIWAVHQLSQKPAVNNIITFC